jgi:hypothetical protein
MTIELVSYADLKALLDLEGDEITSYPSLALIRESVTAAIEIFTGRNLESKERSRTIFVGNIPTNQIILKAVPVSSVDSVTVTITDDVETYSSDDYETTVYGIKLYTSIKNAIIQITYTGGISTVPDAISRAALLQTAYEFQSKDQIGATSVSTEGGTVSRPEMGLLKEVKRLLQSEMHPMRW